jgi:predicted metal-dependent hydrolase
MSIPIDRLIRSRRKSVAVIVRPDGTLEVRAPLSLAEGRIQEFVEGHTEWIRKQQRRARLAAPPPVKTYSNGERFLFLGQSHLLCIVPHQRPALAFDGNTFQLAKSAQPKAKQYFARWYKAQALEMLTARVQALAGEHGFTYQKVRISSARTRWGSCSSKGTLSFTWRLMMAPPEIVDYVVVHELVHTKIRNHSASFWHAVTKLLPDTRQYRAWLRKNGKYLSLD